MRGTLPCVFFFALVFLQSKGRSRGKTGNIGEYSKKVKNTSEEESEERERQGKGKSDVSSGSLGLVPVHPRRCPLCCDKMTMHCTVLLFSLLPQVSATAYDDGSLFMLSLLY